MTHANSEVLEFYRELPFNYRESVETHVDAIRKQNSVNAYPILQPYLSGPDATVLEVGCGVGWLSNAIAYHHKCSVRAIDFNPVAVERAQAINKGLGGSAEFSVADLFEFEPGPLVDVAISIGVLHHTNDCIVGVERICTEFVRPGGHVFIGLYHSYGRQPFLDEFSRMRKLGASEDALFERFRELDPRFNDEIHLRSWFRDQVLHPHETQHSMCEISAVLKSCSMTLISSSINKFEKIESEEALWEEEKLYTQLAQERLAQCQYFPGFFVFLAQRNMD